MLIGDARDDMQFDHYANRAAEVAADLVNARLDGPLSLAAVTATLDEHDVPVRATAADLAPLDVLADEVVAVFGADTVEDAIAALNDLLSATPMTPRIAVHDDRGPHMHVERAEATAAERLRANTLMGLAAVLCDGGRLRVGTCDADTCERVYVDTSRNARRRFCSDRCATRTHVAAHRARRASA